MLVIVITLRRRVALFAALASVLLSLGDVVAWSPRRPAKSPKTVVPKESHLLKWASAGFLAASLTFAPLATYAEEATVSEPPLTAVKVNVETNSLIRSIEDNGGQLNKAVSSLVKNIPSNSIKLDPPKEKAEAIRAAITDESAVAEQEVSPSDAAEEATKEKTESIRAAIKEESAVVEQEVTPSDSAEEKIVDQMEETTVEQVEEKVTDEPNSQLVEQVNETPTQAVTDDTAATGAEETKTSEQAQEVVENAAETPEKAPIVKVDESGKDEPKVQMKKEDSKGVMTEEESETEPVTIKSPAKQIVDDHSENGIDRMAMNKELINIVSADITRFWNSPSGYSVTLPTPVGQEGRTYELSKLNVLGGSLLGLGASYFLSYVFLTFVSRTPKEAEFTEE